MEDGNAIPTQQFKDAHYMWGQSAILTFDPNPHYIWEREMQYLHDNLRMHIVCGGKMQCPHYNPNPHYTWERETQYIHDNLRMQTICVGKVQYPHYDLNPHYISEREMQYLHDSLKMHSVCGWQNAILIL